MLSVFLMFVFYSASGQQTYENQLDKRDSLVRLYQSHQDTVTVNTWLNIRRSNQYLEEILRLDSSIFTAFPELGEKDTQSSRNAEFELTQLQHHVDSLNLLLENALKPDISPRESNNTRIILGAAFIALLLFSLAQFITSTKKLKEKETRLKEYHSDLYAARQEIEALEKTQITLASEVNRLNREIASFEDNKQLLQQLADDKLLLEQQIQEMRKAYLAESEKRKASDDKLMLLEDEKNTQILKLQSDIALLKEALTVAETFQSKLLKEMNGLINKIRNRFN